MRILCLHGKGTSGEIFKSQTSSLRSRLTDLNITFDFLDGEYPCDPAAGIDLFYPAPYYSHFRTETLDSIHQAVRRVREHIAANGPYDALMMFSQGCALGATLLLQHGQEGTKPPVSAAIFICGGPPLGVLEDAGYEISDAVRVADQQSRMKLSQQADSAAILAMGSSRWAHQRDGVSEAEIRGRLGAGPKIGIPTVHVYGSKDPRYEAGVLLSAVCEEDRRKVYDHGGGHEIPRTSEVSNAIADMVRWALREGRV